jgi:ribosomal protein S18 acetylase RimI-like enzyme
LRLALVDGRLAGCVALREIEPEVEEIKRLYVVPDYRNRGIGEALILTVINDARTQALRTLRLDTIPKMNVAKRLYNRLGFRPTAPCYYNPIPRAVYVELDLNA